MARTSFLNSSSQRKRSNQKGSKQPQTAKLHIQELPGIELPDPKALISKICRNRTSKAVEIPHTPKTSKNDIKSRHSLSHQTNVSNSDPRPNLNDVSIDRLARHPADDSISPTKSRKVKDASSSRLHIGENSYLPEEEKSVDRLVKVENEIFKRFVDDLRVFIFNRPTDASRKKFLDELALRLRNFTKLKDVDTFIKSVMKRNG